MAEIFFFFFFSSIEVSDTICSEIHSLSVLTADIYLEKSAPLAEFYILVNAGAGNANII